MAKIKSFTDFLQSKVLAEILPVESADMAWCNNSIRGINYTDEYSANLYTVKEMQECFDKALRGWDKYWELIPCWNLAALLELIRNFQPNNQSALFVGKEDGYLYMSGIDLATHGHNNPVDACYEMIIKLNEQKLL